MNIDGHSNFSHITKQEILNCRIPKNNTKSLKWENYWYIAYQKAFAWGVDHNLAATGSGKKCRVFLSTVSHIGAGNKLGDTGDDHVGNLQAYKILQLDQRKQNAIPEDEKLPSYVLKELI